jgi:hypothetical protein
MAGVDGDLDLGADPVGRRHQHRVLEAGALQVEQPAEAANLGVGASPCGRPHQRLDQVDHGVAGVDVDAGLRIGQARAAVLVHIAGSRARGSVEALMRGRGTAESAAAQWLGVAPWQARAGH